MCGVRTNRRVDRRVLQRLLLHLLLELELVHLLHLTACVHRSS